MPKLASATILIPLLAAAYTPGVAGARDDVRVRSERDAERNTVYYLVNSGSKTVRVRVRLTKTCTGIANAKRPAERDYWVSAGDKLQIGKAWPRTTCRRDYRIIAARY